ncbi:hypothetical protein B0H14DRAFT_3425592 [Mycena olivaceomarginata]|nr:hypothetical protein B0H14DRAFT_3425592 [Mycena olivaceomarginata]
MQEIRDAAEVKRAGKEKEKASKKRKQENVAPNGMAPNDVPTQTKQCKTK